MLGLIRKPLETGISVAGGLVGVARSFLPPGVPGSTSGTSPAPPGRHAPTPEATDWDVHAPVTPGGSAPDDLIIRDRVQSEIFRPADADKGHVNVSVENGVVYLRGAVDDADQAEYFAVAAGDVEGVVRVVNLVTAAGR
jgi:hypothetical protein